MNIFSHISKAYNSLASYHKFAPHAIASAAGIALALFGLRKYCAGGVCVYKPDMTGKVIIVTGANTGVGKATATELAKLGATIVVACRDTAKGDAAVSEIKRISKNQNVKCMHLDLTDFDSVRKFVDEFTQVYGKLDVLVNNAGLVSLKRQSTKNNLELTMATNHFGPFLLTNLLLDLLKKSNSARIVNVSSKSHEMGEALKGLDFDDLNNEKSFVDVYNKSKLANVLFTYELQKRLSDTNIVCSALHPGLVDSEFFRDFKGLFSIWATPMFMLCAKSTLQGAQTTLHCVLKPDLEKGKYYADCKAVNSSPISYSEEQQRKLWEASEKITGLAQK